MEEAMTAQAERFGDLRLASGLIRTGTGLLVLGLGAGLILVAYYFYATQFSASAAVTAKAFSAVWPWAEPVLDLEGFGIALDGLGLALLAAQPRLEPGSHEPPAA
jgi:hypothetical protein